MCKRKNFVLNLMSYHSDNFVQKSLGMSYNLHLLNLLVQFCQPGKSSKKPRCEAYHFNSALCFACSKVNLNHMIQKQLHAFDIKVHRLTPKVSAKGHVKNWEHPRCRLNSYSGLQPT